MQSSLCNCLGIGGNGQRLFSELRLTTRTKTQPQCSCRAMKVVPH